MSPIVRGRAIAQIEDSGRTKKSFDILLWTEELSYKGFRILDEIQQLREYLGTIHPQTVSINIWLPEAFTNVHNLLNTYAIATTPISTAIPSQSIKQIFGQQTLPAGMLDAVATALSCDADMVVTENAEWYPFYEEFEKLNVLLGSPDVILRQSEIFVCGHDIPWSFNDPMFDAPWGPFYFFAEHRTMSPGQRFLDVCHKKGVDKDTQEVGRSLVYNRIPNMLFTRDRLLFYSMQQAAARRANWKRQKFQFEVGYHLNFYYVLLYGGFDHLAVLLNGALRLGLAVRDVTATGERFLKELKNKSPDLHKIFTDPELVDFIERIGSLRHSSAHRSQIMPAPLYESPDHEPTDQELDAEIHTKGMDAMFRYFPAGPIRDSIRENLRFTVRMSKYKVIFEDAVFLDTKKKKGFINPLLDTEWNFSKFYAFFSSVLDAASKLV
jgi:hypothetical protein